ncbi:hypothetical protein QFW96_27655 [Saccharopolyspora sp. TS4A08]|uniref:Uncharacterized protein n=1 Tax=Saccharopolyspora ipomoeae TaxID=3042027 RepID=A0ABT6PWQ1_9PSEU|nr:hypothetical protein [Saccharopolyspora sp. TS4A08]MDI2032427.1 hypothetical protein [Saccharopolyspora sp. TS4A08]
MNVSTPVRPENRSERNAPPVAPVAFREPVSDRTAPEPRRPRVHQDEETLRPLRTPFTPDAA